MTATLGKPAEARPVDDVADPGRYEAFVIGSAIYYGSWLKEATEWVRRHQAALFKRPVWLWSVGPLGTDFMDNEQQPQEKAEFQQAIARGSTASSSGPSTRAGCRSLNA